MDHRTEIRTFLTRGAYDAVLNAGTTAPAVPADWTATPTSQPAS